MDVYEEIEYKLWCEKEGLKASFLSPFTIAQSFSQEALEILPRINGTIKKRLLPLREKLASYHEWHREKRIDEFTLQFYLDAALVLSGQNHLIELLNRNNTILKLAKQHKVSKANPNKTIIDENTIYLAKLKPILQMYSFEKVKRLGNKTQTCCPFHAEKTPSFFIFANNSYHCFSCSANGSAIDFYMKIYNVDFLTAVKALVGV